MLLLEPTPFLLLAPGPELPLLLPLVRELELLLLALVLLALVLLAF